MSEEAIPQRVRDDGDDNVADDEELYCHIYDSDDTKLGCRGPMSEDACGKYAQSVSSCHHYRFNRYSC